MKIQRNEYIFQNSFSYEAITNRFFFNKRVSINLFISFSKTCSMAHCYKPESPTRFKIIVIIPDEKDFIFILYNKLLNSKKLILISF